MAEIKKKAPDTKPEEPVAEETPKWAASPDFLQSQMKALYGNPYSTSSRRGYGYYGQTAEPARKKALATTLGISTAGAVVEGLISASRMFDSGIKYAERELAEAEGIQREPTPKMTEDEKYEIRTASLAPARAEAAEIKSDVGALMASRGGATVADLLRVRESGTETLATAGLEAEAVIGKKELQGQQKHDQRVQMAQQRADQMTQTLFEARQEGRDHKAGLIRDITKVAAEVAAEWPSEDDRPAMDRMLEGNMTMEEIKKIHEKAVYSAFRPGTHAYNTYMMAAYSDWKEKQPEPAKRTADVPVAGTPAAPAPPPPAAPKANDTWEAKEGTATLLDNGEVRVVAKGKATTIFSGSDAQILINQWKAPAAEAPAAEAPAAEAPAPAAAAQGDTELDQAKAAWLKAEQAVKVAKKAEQSAKTAVDRTRLSKEAGLATQARVQAEDAYSALWGKANPNKSFNRREQLAAAAAPAAAGEEGAKVVFVDTTKFWADKTPEDSNNFRAWVRATYPEVTRRFKWGAMQTADNLGPAERGTTQKGWPPTPENNVTFAEVWKKHGKQYVEEVLNQPPAK